MKAIELSSECMGGIPTLRGHRITVSQILAEMAEGRTINEITEDMDLEPGLLSEMLNEMSLVFGRRLIVVEPCGVFSWGVIGSLVFLHKRVKSSFKWVASKVWYLWLFVLVLVILRFLYVSNLLLQGK